MILISYKVLSQNVEDSFCIDIGSTADTQRFIFHRELPKLDGLTLSVSIDSEGAIPHKIRGIVYSDIDNTVQFTFRSLYCIVYSVYHALDTL